MSNTGVFGDGSPLGAAPVPRSRLAASAPKPEAPVVNADRPCSRRRARALHPGTVAATARRVIGEVTADRRVAGLVILMPSVLLWLNTQIWDSQTRFNGVAINLMAIMPFAVMFALALATVLQERTSGTLERMRMTAPSTLDLAIGYGVAFALAASLQAGITCVTAYALLDLYTAGSAAVLLGFVAAGSVLGAALGLLVGARAATVSKAVQLIAPVLLLQVFLGGVFTPREKMAEWLEPIADLIPLAYSVDGLREIGGRSLVTDDLLGDAAIVLGVTLLALTVAAAAIRRRITGSVGVASRRRLPVRLAALALGAGVAISWLVDLRQWISTENAVVDGQQQVIVAPAAGRLVEWRPVLGSTVRPNEVIGRLQIERGALKPRMVLRAELAGTVVATDAVAGSWVTPGTPLAVVYDLPQTYITAHIDETDLSDVRIGAPVQVTVDTDQSRSLTGTVWEIRPATLAITAPQPPNNTAAGSFDRIDQRIPVKIAIVEGHRGTLVPGVNVTVKIRRR